MSDTGTCQFTPWRRSMSKSESDPKNRTINPRQNPNMYIPAERAEWNPNISGFIDESPYMGPGTHLQLQQEGIDIQTKGILNLFNKLQRDINAWESTVRNCSNSSAEIHQRFNMFTKDEKKLSNQALLAAVSTPISRDISNLGDILIRIKLFGLRNVNP